MTDLTNNTKRPSSITLISVFEILGGFLSLYFILSPGIQNFVRDRGLGDTLFLAFSGILILISGIGFWLMKKWAVYTLLAFAVVNQVFLILVGRWNVFSLLILAIPIFVGYRYLSKMT